MILTDYRFLLDVHETNSQISLSFKQGDTGRVLYITLTENGDIFNIPQNCVAVFTALKPDGTIIFNDCEINGNEIVYTHTAQTAAVTGKVDCELRLYGAGNTLITSPHFTIFVHPTVYFDQIESKDEVNTLTNLIYEASTKLANGDFIPKLGIGEVKTLPAGSMATVEMSGTADAPILNFAIPQGEEGRAETIIPDTTLSLDSLKPVQNKVIAQAINERKTAFENHRDSKENPHGVSKMQVGLGNVDNTSDENKPISKAQAEALGKLVEKVEGKALSTNDFTNAYKEKLDGIEAGANKYALPDSGVTAPKIAAKAVSADKVADDARTKYFPVYVLLDWEGDAAPYTHTATVNGLLATDKAKVYFVPPENFDDLEGDQEAFALLYDVESANGAVTFYAKDKPTVEFSVMLEVNRI